MGFVDLRILSPHPLFEAGFLVGGFGPVSMNYAVDSLLVSLLAIGQLSL